MKNTGKSCRVSIWADMFLDVDRAIHDFGDEAVQHYWLTAIESYAHYKFEALKWYIWRLDRIEPKTGY